MPVCAATSLSGARQADGHGTTLVVTDAGLLAIGIEPVVVKTVIAIRKHANKAPKAQQPKQQRGGTKQAMLIEMLQAPEGATIPEIVTATGWMAHSVRGAISGVLKKKLALRVTVKKIEGRGTVYQVQRG